jgi:hypothetical protein
MSKAPTQVDIVLSQSLQDVARGLDDALKAIAGQRINFSLWVWSDGRTQYVSNAQRADVIKALEETIARWKEGMPDIPAHEVRS